MGGSHVRGWEARPVRLWELMPRPTLPPAAPAAAPDVWRRLGPAFPNGSREVTVLIKVKSFLAAPVKFLHGLLLPENSPCREAVEGDALPKEPFDQRDGEKVRPQGVLGAKSLHPCKIHPCVAQPRGRLSRTGGAQCRTPRPSPRGCLSRRSQPLPPRDARGRILGYAVATESSEGALVLCNTSSTACSVLVPPGAHALHVTAYNSRGASSPASVTLGRDASGREGRISHASIAALTETGFYQDCRGKMLACACMALKQGKSPGGALPALPREHNVLQTRPASPGDGDAPQPPISALGL